MSDSTSADTEEETRIDAGASEHVAVRPDEAQDPTLLQLEDEGELAADYIEDFLDICDLDGDIEIEVRNGRVYLAVTAGGETNLRVLSCPDAVQALQELTRLAVQTKTGVFSRLVLDVGGSRNAREAELNQLVDRAIERIDGGATSASLPPMSSYERKLVHDMVAERGFVSESRGEARERYTVITRG
ncbi:protein jag [Rathayibacter toxicus]|uniref:DNA-binding protein n=1 Tax=Rathayibacter toxicus TaxID=145458 RepID=A0A2S5YA19_9MICO|nr:R3H domain-containing nucleic acid-binding protein [Rathayibacter toxicus]PPG24826.1 DNA-binding protein [Rathayibacter toxicus]PPG48281.1 DNA-binding protein [Rathayibacter toxicus]PPH25577.1 DNA-binding protein [Rathayibacter toxicus]PPH59277.1 DNA-binding protein [Rathayibacter toxicus]PPH61389.1 DNA-binding protein [Rathayibacter toxicus]